jgi:hypothetical protein
VPSTAAACPWGSARRMRIPPSTGATPHFSNVRNPLDQRGGPIGQIGQAGLARAAAEKPWPKRRVCRSPRT